MLQIKRSDVEVMAPAGSYEALQAAIDAGADAVYFGVGTLNMRARSSANFGLDDMTRIVQTAHEHGVRAYLTVNTIVYDKYEVPRTINQQISLRFERAISILDSLEIPRERTEHLRLFARNLVGRKK